MKTPVVSLARLAALSLVLLSPFTASAQPNPPAAEETVVLPTFSVASEQPGYLAQKSISGGRIQTDILEQPTSITVITSEFFKEVGAFYIEDVTKYVSGIGRSDPVLDRAILRGFRADPIRVNSFSGGLPAQQDTAIIDRIEVVKGPNAILSPTGSAGGTINMVTKSPLAGGKSYFKIQAGQYNANRVEVDYNGAPLAGGKLLFRVVAAYQDSDDDVDFQFNQNRVFAPSFTFKLGAISQVNYKLFYYDARYGVDIGHPIASVAAGLPVGAVIDASALAGPFRGANFAEEASWRHDTEYRQQLEFTTQVGERLGVRLALQRVDSQLRVPYQVFPRGGTNGVQADGKTFQRAWQATFTENENSAAQLDLVNKTVVGAISLTTVAGGELVRSAARNHNYSGNFQDIDVTTQRATGGAPTDVVLSLKNDTVSTFARGYLQEAVGVFKERVQLSGGYSWAYSGSNVGGTNYLTGQRMVPLRVHANIKNYGVVFHPTPRTSLYYGYNENFTPQSGVDIGGNPVPPITGKGKEFGFKAEFFKQRLTATIAYFDITRFGSAITAFPGAPYLIIAQGGERSKGWEFDLNGRLNENISFIATWSEFEAKNTLTNFGLLNSPDNTASFFGKYTFTKGQLKNLGLGLGVSHMGQRSGNGGGDFFLADYTLADVFVSYKRGPVSWGLSITNALDDNDYIYASGNRNVLREPRGRNLRLSASYEF